MSVALTTVGPVGQAGPMGDVPDPQVPAKARRRTYSGVSGCSRTSGESLVFRGNGRIDS